MGLKFGFLFSIRNPRRWEKPWLHFAAEKILTSRSALAGERKQVTVLFCDLAQSTPLAARLGPEGMHTLLNRFFALALDEIHRYEGTVNQFLGDGFTALFGAPVAHEDHARRAVLAAIGLQRTLQGHHADLGEPFSVECIFRMGLNTGLGSVTTAPPARHTRSSCRLQGAQSQSAALALGPPQCTRAEPFRRPGARDGRPAKSTLAFKKWG